MEAIFRCLPLFLDDAGGEGESKMGQEQYPYLQVYGRLLRPGLRHVALHAEQLVLQDREGGCCRPRRVCYQEGWASCDDQFQVLWIQVGAGEGVAGPGHGIHTKDQGCNPLIR